MSRHQPPGDSLSSDGQIACLVLPALPGAQGTRRWLVARDFIEVGRVTLAGRAENVQQVRQFIANLLGQDWLRLDDVLLLASEIAANAVRHTRSGDGKQFEVMVAVCPVTSRVRVEVTDHGGSTVPVAGQAGEHSGLVTSSRGLGIVDVLADRWGYHGDERGRVVWFEITTKPET